MLPVDVPGDPLDLRYRLIGSDIDAITHRDVRGIRSSALPHMRHGNRRLTPENPRRR